MERALVLLPAERLDRPADLETEALREALLRDTKEERLLRLMLGAERLREETELRIPEELREVRVETVERPAVERDELRLGDLVRAREDDEERLLRLTLGAERLREETKLRIPEELREVRVETAERPAVERDELRLGDRVTVELRVLDLRGMVRIIWDRLEVREEALRDVRVDARGAVVVLLVRERMVDWVEREG